MPIKPFFYSQLAGVILPLDSNGTAERLRWRRDNYATAVRKDSFGIAVTILSHPSFAEFELRKDVF